MTGKDRRRPTRDTRTGLRRGSQGGLGAVAGSSLVRFSIVLGARPAGRQPAEAGPGQVVTTLDWTCSRRVLGRRLFARSRLPYGPQGVDDAAMSITPHASFAYYVPDPGTAADWYRDRLGFEIHGDHRDGGGFRWVTAGPPGAGWQIIFGDVTVHGEGELADRFGAELGFAPHFMLVCDDVVETVRELESKGVEIAEQPHESPFGVAASIKDLHGDAITLADRSGWARLRS